MAGMCPKDPGDPRATFLQGSEPGEHFLLPCRHPGSIQSPRDRLRVWGELQLIAEEIMEGSMCQGSDRSAQGYLKLEAGAQGQVTAMVRGWHSPEHRSGSKDRAHQTLIPNTGPKSDNNWARIVCSMGQKVKSWGEPRAGRPPRGRDGPASLSASPLGRLPFWTPYS